MAPPPPVTVVSMQPPQPVPVPQPQPVAIMQMRPPPQMVVPAQQMFMAPAPPHIPSFGMYFLNFLTFPADFLIPIIFFNLKYNSPNFLGLRNLQEQGKKAFCCQKIF